MTRRRRDSVRRWRHWKKSERKRLARLEWQRRLKTRKGANMERKEGPTIPNWIIVVATLLCFAEMALGIISVLVMSRKAGGY